MTTLFRFRLARLARVREIEAHRAREQWLDAEHDLRAHEAREATCRDEAERLEAELVGERDGGELRPSRILTMERLLENARATSARAAAATAGARQRASEARLAWERRHADLRALERLEERRRDEWREECARRDERALHEIVAALPRRALAGESSREPQPHGRPS